MYIQQTENEIKVLTEYTKGLTAPYVEIGTLEGGTADLARKNTNVPVYSIDIDLSLVSPRDDITFIKGESLEVAKTWNISIGLLFIDGNHFIARQDFEAYEKFVVPGGYVLFHDYQKAFPEVVRDCDLIRKNPNYEVAREPGDTSIIVFRKK